MHFIRKVELRAMSVVFGKQSSEEPAMSSKPLRVSPAVKRHARSAAALATVTPLSASVAMGLARNCLGALRVEGLASRPWPSRCARARRFSSAAQDRASPLRACRGAGRAVILAWRSATSRSGLRRVRAAGLGLVQVEAGARERRGTPTPATTHHQHESCHLRTAGPHRGAKATGSGPDREARACEARERPPSSERAWRIMPRDWPVLRMTGSLRRD